MDSDQLLTAAESRMRTAYGPGAGALPWAQIIAILMQVLSGCMRPPATAISPDQVKANSKRFLAKIQFMRRVHGIGIFGDKAERAWDVGVTTLAAGTDEEVNALVAAAVESE